MEPKLYSITFTARDLGRIHEAHRAFLVLSSFAFNEINTLAIMAAFEHSTADVSDEVRWFITARQLFLTRMTVAKLYEYDAAFRKYSAQIRKTHPSMQRNISEEYKPISRMLGSNSWFAKLRNKVSNHYDSETALSHLKAIQPAMPLHVLMGQKIGMTCYAFAEEIMSGQFFEEIGNGDRGAGYQAVTQKTLEAQKLLYKFQSFYMIKIFGEAGLKRKPTEHALDQKFIGVPNRDYIPLFM